MDRTRARSYDHEDSVPVEIAIMWNDLYTTSISSAGHRCATRLSGSPQTGPRGADQHSMIVSVDEQPPPLPSPKL
jgi:hypothetical protein